MLKILIKCKILGRHLGFQKMVLRNTYDVTFNINQITVNID